ncbi:sister chromatid cohesion 1 protein 1 [Phtheirospermum japonicum]|uniref:Sister chromatid cohesion 1 protein 1 n=1 Tax=Phtheirospermum japonicum TaxID=374723 RepID=A0A830CEA7_9LAMI|nr:sister chromatid cohesion 1 protein 1 [Phtheirospermum japonicum]
MAATMHAKIHRRKLDKRNIIKICEEILNVSVEINEAWKVKAAPSDPTRLPKGKSQAKYEAVTLPPITRDELEDIERSLPCTTIMDFNKPPIFPWY